MSNEIFVLRIEDNQDFTESLKSFCEKNKIQSAIVLGAIGMFKDSVIGFYAGKGKFLDNHLQKPLELVSSHGTIAQKDNEFILHLHCVLADENQKTFGGHFKEAKVHNTCEVTLLKLKKSLRRKFDEKIGLNLLDL